jgi:Zn-dependent M28 family amino/carboxypeptidase
MQTGRRGFSKTSVFPIVVALAFLCSLVLQILPTTATDAESAWNQIRKDSLREKIRILSSDEFEGRAPASRGEALTTDFLVKQFKVLGLEPGNPDGTFFQKVPMAGITADANMQLVFEKPGSGRKLPLNYGDDFVAFTKREQPEVHLDADVVFVGYGVVAPEYHWNDFKDADVKGKVWVVLINDPPVPDPRDPSKLDDRMFKGKAMTYYGRWTYKYEEAAQKGAAGCLIIHETGPAGYPWSVVRDSNAGEQFTLVAPDKGMSRAAVEGWVPYQKAEALFAMAGKNLSELKRAAVDPNFRPVPLGLRASLTLRNKLRRIESNNVIAKLEGHDPKVRDEYVIYTAHWDHLGIGPAVSGKKIYHGAKDNASGVAGLLEIARAFTKVQPPARRSVLFFADTAEEQGLLGSQYYTEHPLYPLRKTLADINMDVLNVLGVTKDVTIIGLGMSTLDDYVEAVAAEQGRTVSPDAEPGKGFYYRSDHFNFARQGVPALDPDAGVDFIGKPPGWGLKMRERWTKEDYHQPSDTIKPYWDLSGAVRDLQLLFEVGYRVANADTYPAWKPGAEFKARRDAMLKRSTVAR